MRYLILILSTFILNTGCSKDDSNRNLENQVLGNWKLIEIFGEDGVGGSWQPVENGYEYNFNSDNTFSSTRFEECMTGNFVVTDNLLRLTFDCDDFQTGFENDNNEIVEMIDFDDGNLILTPTYLNCDEGCDYKFEKISNE